ncbi:hypothetical protein NKG05_03495 [Oerskovia sp. M15]
MSEYSTCGDRGADLADDQAVALDALQGLGEHLLAHAVDASAQRVEAQGAVAQAGDGEDTQRPVTASRAWRAAQSRWNTSVIIASDGSAVSGAGWRSVTRTA